MIQLADPDALSNSAKQEIEMNKPVAFREVPIGFASNFETILSVRELQTPADTIELKFETLFANANDPNARQTKAQFFLNRKQLAEIQTVFSNIASSHRGE